MKRICVYCGSTSGHDPRYREIAYQFGQTLVEEGYELVYGGGRKGLMGSVADGVLQAGGIAIGIVPTIFSEEIIQEGLSELYRVSSMHARKEMMCSLSDGFVALPGRYGTLEEIIEMTTWAQLGLHGHPCGLLNIANYFDGLLSLLDRGGIGGFYRSEIQRDAPRFGYPERYITTYSGL
uniref:Cytokinin riboside 5'-monophosphate phosphoribohydrolase n=1 Tax=Candidatus Kentrum sp. FW TaxID=2126338 RepID=A0A450SKR9_9GAMM|nr:MAG: hypothetical protein BECKFW1821B_GA0114236_101716 [Candidatus Kentron sp. FW]